jgi:UDP-GlcNAc3NAcA epimerase
VKKILTVVGARPQFVKAAVLSRLIKTEKWKEKFKEILVHTGQHYDASMSDVFFEDMGIPHPDYNLNIGSGSHGKMTGQMLIQIEELLLKEKPDIVLVYGDTNSTLAGTLAASKLHIPLAHVEAGLRSFWKYMPEEQNRVLTDHISDFLFCPTETAVKNLKSEGITDGVHNVGDIMLDANLFYLKKLQDEKKRGINRLDNVRGLNKEIIQNDFVLATVHRAENTDNHEKLSQIIEAFNELPANVVLPLHPRTKKMVESFGLSFSKNVSIIDPIGYFEMLELEFLCKCIITDSGGVQKEAYFMKKPCITLRDQTEWVETVESGWNTIVGTDKNKILSAYNSCNILPKSYPSYYGSGNTGESIFEILMK